MPMDNQWSCSGPIIVIPAAVSGPIFYTTNMFISYYHDSGENAEILRFLRLIEGHLSERTVYNNMYTP